MTVERYELGRAGEDTARVTLEQAGLMILARNWRWSGGEIDLIAREGETYVFVEVKLRRSSKAGAAAAAVTGLKQRRIVQAAQAWLKQNKLRERRMRFDVVSVDNGQVRWLRGAFRPTAT